ncbi:hypothetical protein [Mycobacteroides abscessus]|uniref:hypothetical protein n=1 Tax=Mycobacteroides abscessus TaxID=36809 RepID=UPI002106C7E6|nr:hypothetical protein [Mycobacteroides abscessus]
MAEIDKTHPDSVRTYVGQANAVYHTESRRIAVVADSASFADALDALTALRDEVC